MGVNMWLPGLGVEIESNLHDAEITTSKLDPGRAVLLDTHGRKSRRRCRGFHAAEGFPVYTRACSKAYESWLLSKIRRAG